MTPPVQLHCIVCGLGSTRPFSNWVNRFETSIGPLVACDGHTSSECQEHLKRLKATVSSAGNGPKPVTQMKAPAPTANVKPPTPNGPPAPAPKQPNDTGTDAPKEPEQAKSAS